MSISRLFFVVGVFVFVMMIVSLVAAQRDVRAGKVIRGQYIDKPRTACTSKCFCEAEGAEK